MLTSAQVLSHFNASANAVPSTPTGVAATAGQNAATVSWTQPSGGGRVVSYTVTALQSGVSTGSVSADATARGATVPNLVANATYTFTVTALGGTGGGATSAASSAITISGQTLPAGGPAPPFGNYFAWRSSGANNILAGTVEVISKDSLPALPSWTVETWIKNFGSWQTTGSGAGIGVKDPATDQVIAGIAISAGGDFSGIWPGGSQALGLGFNQFCSTCAWIHVAVSYDGTNVRGFVNGQLRFTSAAAAAAAPSDPAGLIDHGAITSIALDDLRISSVAQYTAAFTPPTTALPNTGAAMLWHFDDYPITKIMSVHVALRGQPGSADYQGFFRDATAGGHIAHITTADNNGWEGYNQYLDYKLYSLGQGPSIDELEASGSCWVCTNPKSAADPINTITGEFWETAHDLSVPGRGIALDFNRTYASNRAAVDGPLGFGWTHGYAFGITLDGSGNATVTQATGAKTLFNWNAGAGTFSAAPRTIATLVKNFDNTYTLTQKDQSQLRFDAGGRLTAEVDKDAYATALAYDGSGHITTVTEPAGRALTFTYTGSHITQIADVAGRTVNFTYDGSGNLATVTDVGGGLTQYAYNAQHQLTNMKDAKCSAGSCPGTTNTYAGNQVTSQSDPLGRVTGFSYATDGISTTTTITDPRGFKTQDEYLNGLLVTSTHALGTPLQATWDYQYDSSTLTQTAVIDPLGRATTMTYDSQGNMLTQTDPLGRKKTLADYNTFNQPQHVTDAMGVITTLAYDVKGHLLSSSTPIT